MAERRLGGAEAPWQALFGGGTAAGLSDGQLLSRYCDHSDAAGAAFEALVRRHGPMVLGVCRRALRDPNDVDDAFQATFLVLALRARAVRDPERVGGWLFRVARRVARRTRSEAARRGGWGGAEPVAVADRDPALDRAEVGAAVRAEVDRLPERLRLPVVLCDLEGLPRAEAARRLGWPAGTLHSRLARAREALRDRLSRRGWAPVAALPAASTVPEPLVAAAVRAATGAPTAAVSALAWGVARAMTLTRLSAAAALLASGLAAGLALARSDPPPTAAPRPQSDPPAPAAAVAAPAPDAERWGTFRGRVVFAGEPPAPRVIADPAVTWPARNQRNELIPGAPPRRIKDYEVVAKRGVVLSERLVVDPETRGVRNALVYLIRPTAVRESAQQAAPRSLRFRADRGVFVPHVLAAMEGTEIVMGTDDPIAYDVHAPVRNRPPLPPTRVLYPGEAQIPREVRVPIGNEVNVIIGAPGGRGASVAVGVVPVAKGAPMPVADDIHPWMSAWWLVVDHPYFAVTDGRGAFEIRDVPAGPQQVVVWHEALGAPGRPPGGELFRGEVEIIGGGATVKDFTFTPKTRYPE
jgi:RNA polymerase sigma factor (sigma-70 family)